MGPKDVGCDRESETKMDGVRYRATARAAGAGDSCSESPWRPPGWARVRGGRGLWSNSPPPPPPPPRVGGGPNKEGRGILGSYGVKVKLVVSRGG